MELQIRNLKITLDRHLTLVIPDSVYDDDILEDGLEPITWYPVWFDGMWEWRGKMIYLTLFSISLTFDWLPD